MGSTYSKSRNSLQNIKNLGLTQLPSSTSISQAKILEIYGTFSSLRGKESKRTKIISYSSAND